LKKVKQKTCRICKEKYTPQNSLQKTCWNPKCAIAQGKIDREKSKDKEHKERKREFRKNDKSIQRQAAQMAFNAYIRERDKSEPCISCDKPAISNNQWAAGHYFTTGARPDIRFNEDNCHKQCNRYCNSGLSGNVENYKPRLIAKIGKNRFRELEKVSTVRYTAEDYRNIASHYRQKLKQLKAEEE